MELDSRTTMVPASITAAAMMESRNPRAEVDTSAPFHSVKDAVSRFGELGYWKPSLLRFPEAEIHGMEQADVEKLEQQAAEVEKDLIIKERETFDVLKELESTKAMVEELKLKLQKEALEAKNSTLEVRNQGEKEENLVGGFSTCPAPGLILMELKQAKFNLSRTTNDLADIRASVDLLNKKLENERLSLEKTRERLTLNSSKISSLEEELNLTKMKMQVAKDAENVDSSDNPMEISKELQRLSFEAERFKKIGEAARSEVSRAISEIELTKSKIKTAEMRLVAARKMKEAARAAEASALVDIEALSSSDISSETADGVTLSFQEYSSLTSKAREAEELSKKKAIDAMQRVEEANVSKMKILKKVEDATEEVKTSKKALEEALNRVEAANQGKLAVEEALRKWRSDNGQKRRSVQKNTTKFKNPYPSRKEPCILDLNGISLVSDGPNPKPVLRQTMSIGQILSRKLLLPEEFETEMMAERGTMMKRKISLGQMLSTQNGEFPSTLKDENLQKQFSGKRKKFGFAKFSLLLAKQSKKKKKPTPNLKH